MGSRSHIHQAEYRDHDLTCFTPEPTWVGLEADVPIRCLLRRELGGVSRFGVDWSPGLNQG